MAGLLPGETATRPVSTSRLPALRLAVAWVSLFVVGTDLFVVSPLLPLIEGDFQVDAARAGLLVTVFSFAYVGAAPVLGHWADRMGRRRILLWCLFAFAAGNLLTAFATSLPQLLGARFLCGLVAAGVAPSLYALVGDAAPAARRGTWIAIAVTGLLSALPLGATAGTWAATRVGWASVFAILGIAALLLAVLNAAVWASAAQAPAQAGGAGAGPWAIPLMRALLPTVAWASALYGMYTYLGAGLAAMGYDAGQIAGIILIYGATAFAGALIGGRAADWLGALLAVRISLAVLCLVFAGLEVALRSGVGIGIAVGLTSIAAQTFFPAQQAALIGRFGSRRATALSWNNSALFLGITLGSLGGGQVMAFGGFAGIPFLSIALAAIGLIASSPRVRGAGLSEAA